MKMQACLDPARAGKVLVDAQWFFRAYIALAVAAFFGLMLFPQTSWIYHDKASLWLLSGLAVLALIGIRGLDTVCLRGDVRSALAFAAFHCLACVGAFCAFVPLWRRAVGVGPDGTALSMLVVGSCLCLFLCWTCGRAVDLAFACMTLRHAFGVPTIRADTDAA